MAELHTPGKWQVFEREGRPPFPFEVRVYVGPEDRPTAYRTVAMLHSLAHDRWDAHLIAAAPEMYALLESLHADLARYSKMTEEVWSSGSIAFGSMADDCSRLLAKARGEASRDAS